MQAPITLSAQNLCHTHGRDRAAVRNVSLTLHRGEVLGLLGHNGAGKSTTLQMLAGALPPDAGEVMICNFNLRKEPELAKSCIGFLPEHPPLYKDMRVDEYLVYAARLRKVAAARLAAAVVEVKERCGLNDCGSKVIGTLSKGYQQRIGIAQAIIHRPAVVVLDEPTVGLDPAQLRDIRALIRELGNHSSVILSTHLLNEVENLCDRVVILKQGQMIFSGSRAELQTSGGMEEAFLQISENGGDA